MTDRVQTAVQSPPVAPSVNGAPRPGDVAAAGAPAPPPVSPAAPSGRFGLLRRLLLGLVLLAGLVIGGIAGYRWWYDTGHFVSTNNAQVAGRLVYVGGLAAGRVASVRYDVGEHVAQDDVVAMLQVPVPVGATAGGVPRMEYRQTSDSMIEVRAPMSGVVIARGANPADTVPAGQTLLTLVDPRQLWINANVEETQIRRVRPGQRVTVHIDTLAIDLEGRVVAVTPASAATFSLLPSQNVSGNFTHVTQLVPVRIALEAPDPRLMIGTSATVKIAVTD